MTADDGTYEFTNLPAGSYGVQFSPPAGSPYAYEYFDNARERDSAAKILVIAGETAENINASLELGGSISGTVTGPDGATPLAGITVFARPVGGGPSIASGYTANDGTYEITGLPAGSYRVHFWPNAGSVHLQEYFNDTYDWYLATAVSVVAGLTTENIDASLALGGSISGMVTGPDGDTPLAGVWVFANGSGTSKSAQTAPDGTYEIIGLAAGDYRVQFSPPTGSPYASEYFDNARDWNSATAVIVTGGSTTSDINAILELGGSISGTVTGQDGLTPLPGVWVSSYTGEGAGGGAYTDADGIYTITGLPAGSHRVQFFPSAGSFYTFEFFNNTRDWNAATEVSVVAGQTTTNINALLELGGFISGRVTGPDGATPLPGVWVYALDWTTWGGSGVMTADDGTYEFTNLPAGSYRVKFSPPAGSLYAYEYFDNARERDSAAQVSVVAGLETTDIDALLEPAFAVVTSVRRTGDDKFKIDFAATPNMSFQLKISGDLNSWANTETFVTAIADHTNYDGNVGTNSIEITTSASRQFWKLFEIER